MAINDKDFYASHGLDFDYKNMLDEYIKGVIKQAKIEVLTEIQSGIREIEEDMCIRDSKAEMGFYRLIKDSDVENIIQEKINKLKGEL